ncbi:MAG: ABC transporter substrate-binding protein [Beijerinckiaceae bacterium]
MDYPQNRISRRTWLAAGVACLAQGPSRRASAAASAAVRLGILQFGTVQWVADVILRNHLGTAHGLVLQTLKLANTEAGRIALMAGSADVVVSDWTLVASQRAAGNKLSFAPFSSAMGGIMVRSDSPLHTLGDLKGRALGVAGGPLDKSWLIIRAAAHATQGIDLAAAAQITYGASPLLAGKLEQGALDAVLSYWNFAARLEAAGFREMLSVADAARELGLPNHLGMLGFVFHEEWARQNLQAIEGFLAAATAAELRLAESDAEWQAVRPLMNAPADALFASLKRRFLEGISHPSAREEQQTAERVFAILLETGGYEATGGLSTLPAGIFWPVANAS